MPIITLEALRCHETEDWGSDECRLEVRVDGVLQLPLNNSLNEGQAWVMNRSYDFQTTVEVKLWDEDSPDPDDFLGKVEIDASPATSARARFQRDGVNYELRYTVIENTVSSGDPVADIIAEFEQSTAAGVWSYIAKADLLDDIRRTASDPLHQVRQGSRSLCGPAAIVYELVSRAPRRYVEMCWELYETGRFTARTMQIEPSQSLLVSRVPARISYADWMLMATMRDAENTLFPVEAQTGAIEGLAGITTPWEMTGWTSEILGFDTIDYESTYLFGEMEALRKANHTRNRGGVAFLMIHSAMLGSAEPITGHPNHWVSFLGSLAIDEGAWNHWDDGQIEFDCYSWGDTYRVQIGEGPFEDYFWGIVTGKP